MGAASTTTPGLTLGPAASATLSLEVSIPREHELGTIRASFLVRSEETAAKVPIVAIVSSDIQLDFTVVVEDEYTYFAQGKPLVRDATVQLVNAQRAVNVVRSTQEMQV